MVDASEGTRPGEPVGKCDGGYAAVVVPDEGHAGGPSGGGRHRLGVGKRARQRLLARDVLAGLQRRDRLLGMDVVRSGDVDQADLGCRDRGPPVRARDLPSPAGGECIELARVATDHGVHDRSRIDVEES